MRRQIHTTYDDLLEIARPAKQAILPAPSLCMHMSCNAPAGKLAMTHAPDTEAVQHDQTASSTCHGLSAQGDTDGPCTSANKQLDIAQGQQPPNVAARALAGAADGPTVRQRRTAQRVHCCTCACMHEKLLYVGVYGPQTVCHACQGRAVVHALMSGDD